MSVPRPGPEELRAAFGHFPSGVAAVCARGGEWGVGMAVSTFVPVSLDPPLIALFIQRSSRTWPVLRELPRLGVSILAEHHGTAARSLAARDGDRFAGVEHTTADSGAIRIAGSTAYFECSVAEESPAGDHLIALLHVERLDIGGDHPPLVFHRSRFGRLVQTV
ncbi:flavin reductase family protein [Pseudonocardia zijingensis]|jgi:flavin reductase (DIM6/NTAB) family NADH-FMN oxidoreductase RutF|uniref:Flavin reductase family protein n=1 Tax=Pseudonocardia zijingensis TaxID=153376 RepID=A0ABP4ADT9_9PSEU